MWWVVLQPTRLGLPYLIYKQTSSCGSLRIHPPLASGVLISTLVWYMLIPSILLQSASFYSSFQCFDTWCAFLQVITLQEVQCPGMFAIYKGDFTSKSVGYGFVVLSRLVIILVLFLWTFLVGFSFLYCINRCTLPFIVFCLWSLLCVIYVMGHYSLLPSHCS